MTRPRAADDFATIRARMEELRRERAPAPKKESRDPDAASGGRSLHKGQRRPTAARKRALVDRCVEPALRFGTLAGRPGGEAVARRAPPEPGQRRRTSTISLVDRCRAGFC